MLALGVRRISLIQCWDLILVHFPCGFAITLRPTANCAQSPFLNFLVLTSLEIRLLDQLVKTTTPSRAPALAQYLTKIARLGGYLARAKDPPPGTMVMWRGLSRLTGIELGASLGRRLVGK